MIAPQRNPRDFSNDSNPSSSYRGCGNRRRQLGTSPSFSSFVNAIFVHTRVLHTCFEPRVGAATRPFVYGNLARHSAGSYGQSAA